MLAGQLDSLIPWLLPEAVRVGPFWCVGSIRGERGDSLKIHAHGPKAGAWADYACSETDPHGKGDLLALLQHTVGNGDIKVAFEEAYRFLRLDTMDPRRMQQLRERASAAEAKAKREKRTKDESKRRNAERMWLTAEKLTPSSPPVKYLESRGIDFGVLRHLPGAIRYHPKVRHAETGRELPAMATKMCDLAGRHMATHFTFLQFGRNGWEKLGLIEVPHPRTGELIPTKCSKKIWSPLYYGAHIPLWKGEQKCKLGDIAPGTPADVSEGIEDGLSFALAYPERRIIAAATLGNIGQLIVPPQMGDFCILAQRDEKEQAQRDLEDAVKKQQEQARLQQSARVVRLRWPEVGFNDWNDWLRGEKA